MKRMNATSKGWILALMTGIACNSPQQEAATTAETSDSAAKQENKVMIPASACYTGQSGKDSFFLKTEIFPNVVTGTLSYNFFEKDKNQGAIEGVLKGDTLLADYTFMSEGKKSVRQVAFLLRDSTATEGYGEVEEKEGKMVFKDPAALSFAKGIRLQKTPCGER
ncbi:hypothetical protein [Niabella beijingensis]|uniref:hypothetical protein n=1 Tax=Niabella beijingensis TaxID=2872700 RepID=UPI001CBFDCB6|nr:hypothetical protein [Niabella beijingensis]MBZ4188410.1 hypothetical protein [Niabella beijingensis]